MLFFVKWFKLRVNLSPFLSVVALMSKSDRNLHVPECQCHSPRYSPSVSLHSPPVMDVSVSKRNYFTLVHQRKTAQVSNCMLKPVDTEFLKCVWDANVRARTKKKTKRFQFASRSVFESTVHLKSASGGAADVELPVSNQRIFKLLIISRV